METSPATSTADTMRKTNGGDMKRVGFFLAALIVSLFLIRFFLRPAHAAGSISLASPGTYTQNFDTLANTGTSSTVPTGRDFSEFGTNADTTYTAGTGSSTTGDTYSFGTTSSPTDRAFGGLQI